MTDQEMLQAMSKMMDEKLDPIKKEISTIREDLEETREEISMIREDLEEVRTGVNTLLDWAERTRQVLEFQMPKVIE